MAEVSFGEWLKRRRGAKGWTQKQLAQAANCSMSALRKLESEERRPSTQVIQRLAEIFDIPQNEHKSFLRFARGDWQSFFGGETKEGPWRDLTATPRSNLPASITSFVGREKEQAEIIHLVTQNRLVTIAGVGGIGKTRLALHVGQSLLTDYPHGVWFIALDSLSESAFVPQTVASVFDIREGSSDQPLIERLTYLLRQKTALLIFDNCEHLLNACAQLIKTLLTHCPNLKVLATSREVLALEGEAVYYLPALSLPTTHRFGSTESLTQYESIRLFIQRAQLTQTHFSLTAENAPFLIEICQLLDGIPLAIELAAAHVDVLQLKEMLKQLHERFDLVVSNPRAAIPRHQTMRASLDWSWGLLTEEEQRFLRELSVFAGGWTLECAQTVCDGDTLRLTNALVKKSLIAVDQETARETRYHLHEKVRQYMRERLLESGEEENVRTRHLQYFLDLSGQAETGLRGPIQVEWMSRLNDELDNIRAALEWADKTDLEAGLYLASRLYIFWDDFELREGTLWLSNFIENPNSQAHPLARAKGLLVQGWLLHHLDKVDLLESAARECLRLYREYNDKYGEADALGLLACTVDIAQARDLLNQAFSLAQALKDRRRQADILANMGWLDNEYQRRKNYTQEAIELFREFDDWRSLAENLVGLAELTMLNGDLQSAQKWLDEAIGVNQHLNNNVLRGEFLACAGRMAFIRGSHETARVNLEEAATIAEGSGNDLYFSWRRTELGYIVLSEGNLTRAQNLFTETMQNFQERKNVIGVAFALEGMAKFYVRVDKPEQAARLIGWADAARRRSGDIRPFLEQADVDQTIAACLAKIGEVAFSDAYDEGQKLTLDEAVAYALEEV